MASTSVQPTVPAVEDRKYHSDESSVYALPNDSPEHARLETQSWMLEGVMYGDVIHAPLDPEKTTRCIDVGCGTGYVTNAMARKFPHAEVIGLDLSPVPNFRSWEPNVKLFQGNILTQDPADWKAADGSSQLPQGKEMFDLVWSRLLIAGMNNWPGFFKKEFELLKPGGWAECHEMDAAWWDRDGQEILTNDKWQKRCAESMQKIGMDPNSGSNAARRMEEAGFVDVRTVDYQVPLGGKSEQTPFLKKAGDFWMKDSKEVITLTIKRVLPLSGASEEEVQEMLDDLEQAFPQDGDGSYSKFFVTFGRKPE